MLVHRKEIDTVGSSDSFDRWNKSSHDRTELGTLSRGHLAKIQKMSSGLNDCRSHMGHLQRGVLYKEIFSFDNIASCGRSFHFLLLLADEAVRSVMPRARTDFRRLRVEPRLLGVDEHGCSPDTSVMLAMSLGAHKLHIPITAA